VCGVALASAHSFSNKVITEFKFMEQMTLSIAHFTSAIYFFTAGLARVNVTI